MAGGKRGQGEGSIYQLPDGRWRAVLNLGYVWVDGKRTRKRKNVEGRTRGEVAAKLVKLQRDQQQGLPVADDRLTVKAFLADWLARDVQPSVRARTYESYASSVERHIAPAIGHYKLTRLTPRDVQGMVTAVAAKPGCSLRTADYQRIVLRIALNRAMKWEMVARNVAALVDAPKVERREVKPLDVGAVKAFLAAVRDDRHEALFIVATALGLRKGEVLGLRWEDVDLDAATLTVRYQLQRIAGKIALVPPKTERSRRTVNLPAFVVDALTRHRDRQLWEARNAGEYWQGDGGFPALGTSGLVFSTPLGTPLDSANVTHAFHDALQRAELPRQRFHDLRHGAASLMLAQGEDARTIMAVLGHSQISTTMDLYSHVMPSTMRDVASRMDTLLTGTE